MTWTGPLANEVAPVDVVIANEARGFATLDDWHSMGHGPNAIVIYGSNGKVVRQLSLQDLFPGWFVAALTHSVSSIQWRGDPRISSDGSEVIVPVVQPTVQHLVGGKKINLAIRLSDGVPVGFDRPEWKKAFAEAAAIARESCAIERKALKDWNAPIKAPRSKTERDWHHYLREIEHRTSLSADSGAGTTVLRTAAATDFAPSLQWLEDALTERGFDGDIRAIGSLDEQRLVGEIERIAARMKPGLLQDVKLIIVAQAAGGDRIRQALAPSGARIMIVDPEQSIVQKKSRMREDAELVICQAPHNRQQNYAWFALLFPALAGGIFFLRRRSAAN